jgi:hypothetical protein
MSVMPYENVSESKRQGARKLTDSMISVFNAYVSGHLLMMAE